MEWWRYRDLALCPLVSQSESSKCQNMELLLKKHFRPGEISGKRSGKGAHFRLVSREIEMRYTTFNQL